MWSMSLQYRSNKKAKYNFKNLYPTSLVFYNKTLYFEIPPAERRSFRNEHSEQDETLLRARSGEATPGDL